MKNGSSYDALHISTQHGHLDIMLESLCFCRTLSTPNDLSNSTPLYLATIQGNLDVVNMLLRKLIKFARRNEKTALHSVDKLV